MKNDKPQSSFTPPIDQVHQQVMAPRQRPAPQTSRPYVHPSVQAPHHVDPEQVVNSIAEAVAQSTLRAAPNKYVTARPGDPPPMPPLEGQALYGMTMAQQAGMHGDPAEARVTASPNSIIQPARLTTAPEPDFNAKRLTPQQLGILPSDMLPEEVRSDPSYVHGGGSMYAVNQPHLAQKYGVIRNGHRIPGQVFSPHESHRGIEDTLSDLQAATSSLQAAEEDLTPEDQEPPAKQASREEVKQRLAELDSYELDALQRGIEFDNINNPEQKRIIEARLKPLSLTRLLVHGREEQVVPVIPGELEYRFQSIVSGEDLEVKRIIERDTTGVAEPGNYYLLRFSMLTLAIGIVGVNKQNVPFSHLDANGTFSEEGLMKKFEWLRALPGHMVASMLVNHGWFEMRVRRMFEAKQVKNG